MGFYQRLKDLKEDADLTQKQVAAVIGVSINHYGKYERGETDLPLEKAIILADYYDVLLDYLAGRTNNKKWKCTPDFYAELLKDDHFTGASNLSDEVKQTDCIGRIAGFNVYEWNDDTANLACIAGHPRYATRAHEFSSDSHIVDLEGDANYVNASASKGRAVFDHIVLRKKAILAVFTPAVIRLAQTAVSSGKVTITTSASATDSFIYRVNPVERASFDKVFTDIKESNIWTSGSEISAKKGDTIEIIDIDSDDKCKAVGYITVS